MPTIRLTHLYVHCDAVNCFCSWGSETIAACIEELDGWALSYFSPHRVPAFLSLKSQVTKAKPNRPNYRGWAEPSRSLRQNIRPMFGVNRTSVQLYPTVLTVTMLWQYFDRDPLNWGNNLRFSTNIWLWDLWLAECRVGVIYSTKRRCLFISTGGRRNATHQQILFISHG